MRLRSAGLPAGSPSTVTAPPATSCTPTMERSRVDFPQPLGPSSPVTVPRATATSRSGMTSRPPRTTRSPSTEIAAGKLIIR